MHLRWIVFISCIIITGHTSGQNPQWIYYNTLNSGIPVDDAQSIAIDQNGDKWITHNGYGVSKFDGNSWVNFNESNSGISSNMVYPIKIDGSELIWLGTDNGLCTFDGTTWNTYNTSNSGISENLILSIGCEDTGITWAGMRTAGLSEFDGVNWTSYNYLNGYPAWRIKTIAGCCMFYRILEYSNTQTLDYSNYFDCSIVQLSLPLSNALFPMEEKL
jgi:ligand-binding sensor domain-containing protein